MTAQEYFEQALFANLFIETNESILARSRELRQSVFSTIEGDKSLIAAFREMDRDTEAEIRLYTKLKNDVCGRISAIKSDTERPILRKRYIEGKKWETIASEMRYTVRNCIRIHEKALSRITL